jgi:hypothetical protein
MIKFAAMKTKTDNKNNYTKTAGYPHNVAILEHLKSTKGFKTS